MHSFLHTLITLSTKSHLLLTLAILTAGNNHALWLLKFKCRLPKSAIHVKDIRKMSGRNASLSLVCVIRDLRIYITIDYAVWYPYIVVAHLRYKNRRSLQLGWKTRVLALCFQCVTSLQGICNRAVTQHPDGSGLLTRQFTLSETPSLSQSIHSLVFNSIPHPSTAKTCLPWLSRLHRKWLPARSSAQSTPTTSLI